MCISNINRKVKVTNDEDAAVYMRILPLSEHTENSFLNTDLRRGILGSVYAT